MPHTPVTCLKHPEFRGSIGVARIDITPPVGIYSRTWGSARHDSAEGVHQPLTASALVFRGEKGASELILIAMDAIVLPPDDTDKIRASILERFQLKPAQLMLHPSHSHSAPFLARKHADRPGGHLLAPYLDSLPPLYVKLVEAARSSVQPATLSWAYGKCGLAYNRDSVDAATNRDICGINLGKTADDTLLVGRVTDATGRIIATIVNYACHPVSMGGGNRLLSPDYPGPMRALVESKTGGAVCVFLHGASGELTPRRSYEGKPEAAEQNGRELGYAALSVLTGMLPPGQELKYQGIEESGTPLGVWRLKSKAHVSTTLSVEQVTEHLPLKALPPRAELEAKLKAATERFEIERIERSLARRDLVDNAPTGKFEFAVWRLGEAFLVGTPAEPYSLFQTALREKYADTTVAVLNLSDGTTTYLPVPIAFKRDTYQVRVALYEPGSLERVTKAAATAIHNLAG